MEEKCKTCPARDICGGDADDFLERLKIRYTEEITELGTRALFARGADLLDTVFAAFVKGYVSRVAETVEEYESPQPDPDVWGDVL